MANPAPNTERSKRKKHDQAPGPTEPRIARGPRAEGQREPDEAPRPATAKDREDKHKADTRPTDEPRIANGPRAEGEREPDE